MATQGFPGTFQGGFTIGYLSIGAVQKQVTSAGYPGTFQGGFTIGYKNIGAVQKQVSVATSTKGIMTIRTGWWGDI